MAKRTNGSFTNCPRCAGRMPKGRAALSRADNKTVICAKCGREEGLIVFYGGDLPEPTEWPLVYAF